MAFESLTFRVHAIQRMLERNVSVEDTKEILRCGKVIESYPNDKPYPSYLVLGWIEHRPLHVVAADNTTDKETVIVTAYEPDANQWDPKFERRR